MDQIFGPGAHEDLFGVRNGLVMSPLIEGNCDTHNLVIVPKRALTDSNAVDERVFRIVDHQIDDNPVHELGMTYKELDDRQLKFLSDARPAARYLYFQYVVTMLLARSSNNNPKAQEIDAACRGTAWATPGPYIRHSMLRALMQSSVTWIH
ncbi:MAG: hypothetical protein FRX48_05106 [Lasallia pustulata]|uniref:HNH nuclease domain-containing protein n=1 Tax=Lasallia pustulata TaxID=136370 RepID=A0A5M8PQG1_9LECA|nr:MAG: hypothetical protein FRX48_05106 [Lasallia pustulata]